MIRRYRSQVTVTVGTTGSLEIPTVLLHFALPQWIFNRQTSGSIHIPLVMWSDGEPTHTPLSPDDNRVADLQIGVPEVRLAIYYYLVAWRQAFQRGVNPSTTNPLFGQILLRQFVSAHLLLLLGNDQLSSIIGHSYDRKTAIFGGRSTKGALATQFQQSATHPRVHVEFRRTQPNRGFRRTQPTQIALQRTSRPILLLIRRKQDLFEICRKARPARRPARISVNCLEGHYGPARPIRGYRGRSQRSNCGDFLGGRSSYSTSIPPRFSLGSTWSYQCVRSHVRCLIEITISFVSLRVYGRLLDPLFMPANFGSSMQHTTLPISIFILCSSLHDFWSLIHHASAQVRGRSPSSSLIHLQQYICRNVL